ncbi:P-loop containing nucleoside triphosphate hydrolase protein, partial [Syncephalis fuscata]
MGEGGGGNNIKVVCRIRPQNKREIAENGTIIVEPDDNEVSIRIDVGRFHFDRIFGMETRQGEIFEYSLRETVEDVLAGYNGTVFAYGQTGSGKTFTMMGADIDNEELRGVVP